MNVVAIGDGAAAASAHTGVLRLAAAVLCAGLLAPAALRAQSDADPPGYREAVDEAVTEFGAHHFEESRSLFARADALFPNARTQRGLGLAEFELRNYVECIRYFEAALASQVRPLDDGLRHDTENLLARARTFVGQFVLETTPPLVQLTVDGYRAALPADRTLALKAGDHVLELRADDYVPQKRRLSVKGGERETLQISLSRALSEPVAPIDERSWYQSPWLWVAVGAVAVGATSAIVIAAHSGRSSSGRLDGGSSGVVIAAP